MAKRIEIDSAEKKKKEQKEQAQSRIKEKASKDSEAEMKALTNKLKKRESEVKLLKKEYKALKDEYLRKAAAMENLRKRVEREKTEFYQYALSEFLKELFTVLDNFERALESKKDGKSLREGVELIYRQYLDLLIKQGVRPIEIKEKKFDPHLHQAFITVESENVDEPEVIQELQKGYILHDRLLRPALVKVVIPKKGKL